MRLVRMSKEVFGFENEKACKAFFSHVLPWNKNLFGIAGEGRFLSESNYIEDEIFLFSFNGNIVSVGKIDEYYTDSNDSNRVYMIRVKEDTLKVLKHDLPLNRLEKLLFNEGYNKKIVAAQGWNIIDKKYEERVLDLIMKNEWKEIL